MKTKEKLEQRAKLITAARALLDTAEKESRDLTAEEQTNYDKAIADAEKLSGNITREQRLAEMERAALEERGNTGRGAPGPTDSEEADAAVPEELRSTRWASKSYRMAYRNFLRNGVSQIS